MTIQEIKEIVLSNGGFWFCVLCVACSLIEISPIKINPWSWLAKTVSKSLNGDVMQEIGNLSKEVKDVKKDVADIREEAKEREATNRRTRILEFGDEILHGVDYSKEHWDNVLRDVTDYEHYCDEHPHYMNHVAKATIKHIKNMYDKHLEDDSFLK